MLRGGLTLEMGFAILLIAPILMYIFITIVEKRREAGRSYEAYVDGKPNRKSNIILAAFIGVIVLMLVLAAVFTQI